MGHCVVFAASCACWEAPWLQGGSKVAPKRLPGAPKLPLANPSHSKIFNRQPAGSQQASEPRVWGWVEEGVHPSPKRGAEHLWVRSDAVSTRLNASAPEGIGGLKASWGLPMHDHIHRFVESWGSGEMGRGYEAWRDGGSGGRERLGEAGSLTS